MADDLFGINQRLIALGQLTEWSATLESTLRSVFCTLVGSKYAAVVAAGQGTDWLIEQCKALADVNLEIEDDHRQAIKDALGLCKKAWERRNNLIHGVKTASSEDGSFYTIRSRWRKITPSTETWTPAGVREVVGALAEADSRLRGVHFGAFDPQAVVLDEALAWEFRRREEAGQ